MKRQSDEFEKNEQLNDDERKDSVDNSVQGNSKEDAQKSLFDDALFGVEATETNGYRSSDSERHHSHSHGSHGHSSHKHHSHRHHSRKKKMPTFAKVLLSLLSIFLVFAIVVTATFFSLRSSGKKDLQPADVSEITIGDTVDYNGHKYVYNENIVTIAFLGIDKENFGLENEKVGTAGQSDTDMLCVIDTATGKATLISIPRETMVDIDIYSTAGAFIKTENKQLCLAYAYGDGGHKSCQNTLDAISRIFYEIPIEKYFALDIEGIPALNDAIGGVTVTSLYDFKEYGIKKGDEVKIKGDFAEVYVRHRDMDSADASLNRLERQKQYIKAAASKVASSVKKDFSVISSLYSTATKYSTTNISLSDVTYLATVLLSKGIASYDTESVQGKMKTIKTDRPEVVNAAFYPDEQALYELVLRVFYTQID